jgi:hypothetical protein
MEHTRKTPCIHLHPFERIPLPLKLLRGGIRFRTPRLIKELENLPKQGVSCHPKPSFEEHENKGLGRGGLLGTREWSGLHFHPTRRPSWMLVQKANQAAFFPDLETVFYKPLKR